jgi:UDP-N-acetylglucosamine diphosphorylase / glucose-1-phosphate thymidylyltransferase / UDP-N-acetylgalactosamine diphosphorylase / glucosamine-1-phosphate N-acetyltransferase / galactosamine-1-phosphate N-acetyltransferase
MRLCLVEDHAVTGLEPLTLTRTVSDLLLGTSSLGEKQARAFGIGNGPARRGCLIRPWLVPIQRERHPLVTPNDPEWLAREPVIFVNSRWVPPASFLIPSQAPGWVGFCEGQVACAWVQPEDAVEITPNTVDDWFDQVATRLESFDVGGAWISRPWDLVNLNNDQIIEDFHASKKQGVTNRHLSQMAIVGPADRLFVHERARIDPYTVFDTTSGPIHVAANAWIQPFTRLEGPCYIGPDSQLFRANLRGGVSIGPNCRIGGEVESSIVLGHSNKYHEGFLGHAYVGEWVNLGAITSNSDLRNDYGEVQVPLGGHPVPTGQAKVGCFLGDHTRTGMGSMLNTGTVVGVMCNVLPAGWLLPKHVPSFSAVLYGKVSPGFPLEQMFDTARIVKGRRKQLFTETEELLFRLLHEQTRLERERAFQRAQERRGDDWSLPNTARR